MIKWMINDTSENAERKQNYGYHDRTYAGDSAYVDNLRQTADNRRQNQYKQPENARKEQSNRGHENNNRNAETADIDIRKDSARL